jgi:chromosome segregation ATPase
VKRAIPPAFLQNTASGKGSTAVSSFPPSKARLKAEMPESILEDLATALMSKKQGLDRTRNELSLLSNARSEVKVADKINYAKLASTTLEVNLLNDEVQGLKRKIEEQDSEAATSKRRITSLQQHNDRYRAEKESHDISFSDLTTECREARQMLQEETLE